MRTLAVDVYKRQELPSLKGGTGRKHDIRPHGRVCHEEVCINKEIQAFKEMCIRDRVPPCSRGSSSTMEKSLADALTFNPSINSAFAVYVFNAMTCLLFSASPG